MHGAVEAAAQGIEYLPAFVFNNFLSLVVSACQLDKADEDCRYHEGTGVP